VNDEIVCDKDFIDFEDIEQEEQSLMIIGRQWIDALFEVFKVFYDLIDDLLLGDLFIEIL
jgi:hypothetical protein